MALKIGRFMPCAYAPLQREKLAVLTALGDDLYYDLQLLSGYIKLPFCIRVLVEAAVRNCNESDVTTNHVKSILYWRDHLPKRTEIPFKPARVLLQDFTGVPCVADLAVMRDAIRQLGGDPATINPTIPVDLVVDHSVAVDFAGSDEALKKNRALEMKRNEERFKFLKWGGAAFTDFRVVPPGCGIVHQINLEYLAPVVSRGRGRSGQSLLFPDTVVGTDSHTTMINGIGVLGWGVGGIEAEAAMLGQPLSIPLPEVVGFRLTGRMREGCTSTDLVLTIVQQLRKLGVVGKFVEFYGDGVDTLSVADRATISNMAPECGATVNFFPVDAQTITYLRSNREALVVDTIESYLRRAGLFRTGGESILYTEDVELDLGTVEPCVSGPKRPHDRVPLSKMKTDFQTCLGSKPGFKGFGIAEAQKSKVVPYSICGKLAELRHGSVVIAAITSCTNTSNPSVLIAAGLLAKKAIARGLAVSPGVKTSLSPGSHVVTEYLTEAGLQSCLDHLGFHTTGYGCMTCIGNSGDLVPEVRTAIIKNDIVAAAVLSGNRNFEARIHPLVAANYLASPPLVVAYALAGNVDIDFSKEPLGGNVFLKDIWPTNEEIVEVMTKYVHRSTFSKVYPKLLKTNEMWNKLDAPQGLHYQWDDDSTYLRQPPYFEGMTTESVGVIASIAGACCLALFSDSVTTDHISPAGNIAKKSPAAKYLEAKGVSRLDFNSYGARRGNHDVMVRGTFANTRLANRLVGEGTTGPVTRFIPTGETLSLFDAAMKYADHNIPLVVIAGKEYGSGSSRDWAAKGSYLLGVKAVIAESFERIHRSNLVGMGIIPLEFEKERSAKSHGICGQETFDLDLTGELIPGMTVVVKMSKNGVTEAFNTVLRIDTPAELEYVKNGGILQYVLRRKLQECKEIESKKTKIE